MNLKETEIIDRETLLNHACKKGFIYGVKVLLENGFDPNLCKPIEDAISNHHDKIVELLIDHGAKIDNYIFAYALINGTIETLKILLKNFQFNNKNLSTIIFAFKMKRYDVLSLLIDYEIINESNINYYDKSIDTFALKEAVLFAKEDVVKLLIENGADVNFVDSTGDTPLITFIKNYSTASWNEDKVDILKILIENGTNVEIVNNHGLTALMIACSAKNYNVDRLLKIITILIESGANIHRLDKFGQSILCNLFLNHNIKFIPIDLVKLFIQFGANIDHQDENGNTILHHLSLERFIEGAYLKMKMLLELGADRDIRNNNGWMPRDFITEKFRHLANPFI